MADVQWGLNMVIISIGRSGSLKDKESWELGRIALELGRAEHTRCTDR